jgi:hypothetical protein
MLIRTTCICKHHGKGLALALLELSQPMQRSGKIRTGDQVKATKPLQRQQASPAQDIDRRIQGVGIFEANARGTIQQLQARATLVATIGLAVKPTICGVGNFSKTLVALGKDSHGGATPIPGQLPHNRVARATLGATDKRVGRAAVCRVEHFRKTCITRGAVGWQRCVDSARLTGQNPETRRKIRSVDICALYILHQRVGGRMIGQRCHQAVDIPCRALHQYLHALRSVAGLPATPESSGRL